MHIHKLAPRQHARFPPQTIRGYKLRCYNAAHAVIWGKQKISNPGIAENMGQASLAALEVRDNSDKLTALEKLRGTGVFTVTQTLEPKHPGILSVRMDHDLPFLRHCMTTI